MIDHKRTMPTVEAYRPFINRPNTETPLLLRHHASRGGTMILEYPPIVTRVSGAATRKIDAVLLLDIPELETRLGTTTVYDWELATPDERRRIDAIVQASRTEVLQAKNAALGPYLIGQAHFSRRLVGSASGVAIAGPGSADLTRIAGSLALTVVHDPLAKAKPETRGLLKPDRALVQRYLDRVGGAAIALQSLQGRGASALIVDAIVLPESARNGTHQRLADIAGQYAVAVCSTQQRIGMYVMGAALCAQAQLEGLGAARVEVMILCKELDSALLPLLKDHPNIQVMTR
jgi:hypothetical protein